MISIGGGGGLNHIKSINITLDPRLPFPDSVGGIFLVQPLLTKGMEWFSQLAGLQ